MAKLDKLKQAEHLYVCEKQWLDMIGTKLDISRRTLFYWKKKYEWDKKRFETEQNQENFSNELLDFARKLMQKISKDLDNKTLTPQSEIYSLMKILKNIPQVKQYETSNQNSKHPKTKPQKEEHQTEDIVKMVERDILGM